MIDVDIWVRGTQHAETHAIHDLPADPTAWQDDDVRALLTGMLRAIEREKNPGADAPSSVTLRGFSWIVSPYESRGVLIHLELQIGTATAGPFPIDEARLTAMIARVMSAETPSTRVH